MFFTASAFVAVATSSASATRFIVSTASIAAEIASTFVVSSMFSTAACAFFTAACAFFTAAFAFFTATFATNTAITTFIAVSTAATTFSSDAPLVSFTVSITSLILLLLFKSVFI